MATQLTIDDARESLTAHVAMKGAEIFERYGPKIGWLQLKKLLDDRTCVRYPCEIRFDAGPLLAGEVAYPHPKSDKPEDGFIIFVHPFLSADLDRVPFLVLYQLVVVNYGEFSSTEDAETFGAHALGLTKEDYYRALCAMADELAANTQTTLTPLQPCG